MKVAKINLEQHREIYGKEFKKDEQFNPALDKDGNIFISEVEVNGMSNVDYPWKTELELVEKPELLKSLTKEEWLVFDKQETEKRLQELNAKIEAEDKKK